MSRYSVFSLARNALSGHRDWGEAWRSPGPKPAYDVVIVGAGGHGLATAYYLAKNHGLANIAVLEKSWLGGGNTGRNTTIIRSNYLQEPSIRIYELARSLYEDLSQELDFNVMFSPRGVMMLCQTEHELRAFRRTAHANRIAGLDCRMISASEVKRIVPIINDDPQARYPILGAYWQPRGGTGRHDAVAWGYARAADARGVDIIQNCEVTAIRRSNGHVVGVETTRGFIGANKIGIVAAGHNSVLAEMAGVRLPIESHPLQAFVSEPVKPVLDCVVMSNTVHVYVSQTDRGELVVGAGIDGFNSYAQRGSFHIIEHQMAACLELFPIFSRLKMMRSWGGIVDVCPDASPIIGKLPVQGLFLNGGWGTGGFKATPGSGWVFAYTIAKDEPHPLNAAFGLQRFASGALIDEHGAAAVAH